MTPVAELVDVGSLGPNFESLSDPRHTRLCNPSVVMRARLGGWARMD